MPAQRLARLCSDEPLSCAPCGALLSEQPPPNKGCGRLRSTTAASRDAGLGAQAGPEERVACASPADSRYTADMPPADSRCGEKSSARRVGKSGEKRSLANEGMAQALDRAP